MPRVYVRKEGVTPRATWTEEALKNAANAVESKAMGLLAAAKKFGISPRTLRRRMKKGDLLKRGLGKPPVLGYENEKKLANQIKILEKKGFFCSRSDVRKMAYQLAIKLKIKHNFSNNSKMAGKQWMQSFLDRNKDLTIKQSAGKEFFDLWGKILEDDNLFTAPEQVFINEDPEMQLNIKVEEIDVMEDDNLDQESTSSEKEENS